MQTACNEDFSFDTGESDTQLHDPSITPAKEPIPPGTQIEIEVTGVVTQQFIAGDTSWLNKAFAIKNSEGSPPGSNSGAQFYYAYAIAYDYVNGYAYFSPLSTWITGHYAASQDSDLGPSGPIALFGDLELENGFSSSRAVFVGAPSTLVPIGETTLSGTLSGAADLRIDGPGTLSLTGVSTHTGTTYVDGGRLSVNGSIVSPVNVESGGTLGGTGTISNIVTVQGGGVYAPGNSIGTQTINGALTFGAGGILEIEVNAAGAGDQIILQGTADLTGGILRPLLEQGLYGPSTSYTIINNDGVDPVTGQFASIDNIYAFFVPSVQYDGGTGNDVVLTLVRNTDFSIAAQTANQFAVATALEGLPQSGPLYEALLIQTPAGAQLAFDSLSGEFHATLESAMVEQSRYVRNAVLSRLDQAFDTDVGHSTCNGFASWGELYGGWGTTGATGNTARTDRTIDGFIAGADACVDFNWRFGFAAGGSQASFDNALGADANSENVDLALYAGGRFDSGIGLRAGIARSWNDLSTVRGVSFPGFFDTVSASYDARTSQAFAETSYALDFTAPGSGTLRLEPFAGFAFVNVATDSFQETGGAAALSGASQDFSAPLSGLGLRITGLADVPGAVLRTHAYFGWQHTFGDVDPATMLEFAGGTSPFVTTGAPLAPDSLLLGIGVEAFVSDNLRFSAAYNGEIADANENAIKASASWRY